MPFYLGMTSWGLVLGHKMPNSVGVTEQAPLTQAYVDAYRAHRLEPDGQWIASPQLKSDGTPDLDNWSDLGGSFRQLALDNSLAPACVASPSYIGQPWTSVEQLQAWEKAILADSSLAGAWAYVTDEPTDIAGTAARAKLVRTYAPHLKTMVTNEPVTGLVGLIDHFVPVFEYFKVPGHWQDYTQAAGYFMYGSCMSHGSCANGNLGKLTGTPDLMLDEPAVNARAYPLVAYQLGAEAALYYSAIEAYGKMDPWTDQYQFGGNGDGNLVYPGIAGTRGFATHQPVMSIRMKALRQGQFDVEYLAMAKKAGIGTSANTVVPDQFRWSRNQADYEAMRNAIGNALSR
jgi:hypothetical protein